MQRDQQSLLDIVDSIALISEYVTDWDDFVQSIKDQDAVIRRLTIIGEATKRLSMEFRASHPHIPWKDMAGLRDVVVHEYEESGARSSFSFWLLAPDFWILVVCRLPTQWRLYHWVVE